MQKVLNLAYVAVMALGAAWAQDQIATVTSSAPFILRGASVTPGQGVPTWPIMAGDTLKAGNAPTIVTFPDGSAITLASSTEAKIDSVGGMPVFQLLKGSAHYSLKSRGAVQLMAANQTVTPKGLAGVLRSGDHSGFWTSGHTAAVLLGAGAAAGLGVGISQATGGGAPVSPSR